VTLPMICPECRLPLVPFGGEDVCMLFCNQCRSHDCDCDRDDDDEELDWHEDFE
jgi:hypothetical protein